MFVGSMTSGAVLLLLFASLVLLGLIVSISWMVLIWQLLLLRFLLVLDSLCWMGPVACLLILWYLSCLTLNLMSLFLASSCLVPLFLRPISMLNVSPSTLVPRLSSGGGQELRVEWSPQWEKLSTCRGLMGSLCFLFGGNGGRPLLDGIQFNWIVENRAWWLQRRSDEVILTEKKVNAKPSHLSREKHKKLSPQAYIL